MNKARDTHTRRLGKGRREFQDPGVSSSNMPQRKVQKETAETRSQELGL